MSYSKKEGLYLNAIAVASVSANQAALEVRDTSSGSFWIKWTGAAATDAVVKFQQSAVNDDANGWIDISGATKTLSAASGCVKVSIPITDNDMAYIRAVVTKNSETTALLTVRHYFKGH